VDVFLKIGSSLLILCDLIASNVRMVVVFANSLMPMLEKRELILICQHRSFLRQKRTQDEITHHVVRSARMQLPYLSLPDPWRGCTFPATLQHIKACYFCHIHTVNIVNGVKALLAPDNWPPSDCRTGWYRSDSA